MKFNQAAVFPLLLALLLPTCQEQTAPQALAAAANTPTVRVGHPLQHTFSEDLQLTGTARPNQTVKLYAMTSGFLSHIHADIGDFVKAGQTLALLDNPELDNRKAQLAAELSGKKSLYIRLKGIYQKTPQLTTIIDVEKAQADYESLRAQLDGVSTQIDFLTVKAPFSGVITRRYADKGAVIQSGMSETDALPLFELQDIKTLRVEIDVPETDVALIDKTTRADISFPEVAKARYSATVSRLAYGLDAATKTMKVEIDIPNPDFKLRPGLYAKVELQNSQRKTVLAAPNEAVGNIKAQSFVYVVNNGTVKKVEVKTGLRDKHFTELLNSSINEADTVVIQGKELISDGASVQVKS